MSTYSPLHQTNSTEREYGSNQNTVGYEYFPITNFRPPLKYSGSKLVQPDDYLFISTGEYGVPKLFGQLKNYNFTSSSNYNLTAVDGYINTLNLTNTWMYQTIVTGGAFSLNFTASNIVNLEVKNHNLYNSNLLQGTMYDASFIGLSTKR